MVQIIKEKEYFDLTLETMYIVAQNLRDQSPCPTLEQTIHRQLNRWVLPFMCSRLIAFSFSFQWETNGVNE